MQKTWLCAYARITSEEGTGEAASKSIIAMLFQRKNVSMNRRIAKFKQKTIPPRIALHFVYGAECSTHNPRVWISLSHNRLQLLLIRWFETRRPPHDWDRDVLDLLCIKHADPYLPLFSSRDPIRLYFTFALRLYL